MTRKGSGAIPGPFLQFDAEMFAYDFDLCRSEQTLGASIMRQLVFHLPHIARHGGMFDSHPVRQFGFIHCFILHRGSGK